MDRLWQWVDCLGLLGCNLCYKLYFGMYEAGIDHGIRVHKVEPMLGSGHEQ